MFQFHGHLDATDSLRQTCRKDQYSAACDPSTIPCKPSPHHPGQPETIFRRQSVIHGNNLDLRQIGDRNAFDQRSGIGIESSAMQIDQTDSAICFWGSSGVMISVRTPPIIFSSTFTGKCFCASAEPFARHWSVAARRSANVAAYISVASVNPAIFAIPD